MAGKSTRIASFLAHCFTSLLIAGAVQAAEDPYFITYSHQMEEPGNLEIATRSITGRPGGNNRFWGAVAEFEYGVTGWWTMEFYLDGQATSRDSALFTGYRWENRFRVLAREHWINPVLYVEFENINGADRGLLEVVGHDGQDDFGGLNSETRLEKKRELEAKLILGSNIRGWNISENFIAEKNVRHAPFEFGYAVGANRPLALAARSERCNFCPEKLPFGRGDLWRLGDSSGFRIGKHVTLPGAGCILATVQRHYFQDISRLRSDRYQRSLPAAVRSQL